jgi:hypothetical protein
MPKPGDLSESLRVAVLSGDRPDAKSRACASGAPSPRRPFARAFALAR